MFLKCGYLSAREILRMIRMNRTTNYPALGKKCRIVDVESRDAVYRSTTVTDIGPCAPKTRACSISAVFDGPDRSIRIRSRPIPVGREPRASYRPAHRAG